MSCVAEPKATASAHHTTGISETRGSVMAMLTSAAMMVNCDSSSQLRRRPNRRVRSGIGSLSTKGAQTHLNA